MYQLEVDIEEAQRGKEAVVDFDYGRNSITIRKSDYDALYININDEMFDMDKNIRVFDPSGKLIFDGIVQRKKSRLLHSFHVYGGIFAGYPGRIDIHDKGRSAGDAFIEIEGGPIWGNDHARKRCPEVLAEWLKVNPGMQAEWNGEWSTTIQGKMSVCRIKTQKFLRQGDRIYP
ncbi:MAG: mannan-binding lectin [Lachnospiraceae bacterium]|nr:mannan-binding lectin [Lachnospiraceae bacterium]